MAENPDFIIKIWKACAKCQFKIIINFWVCLSNVKSYYFVRNEEKTMSEVCLRSFTIWTTLRDISNLMILYFQSLLNEEGMINPMNGTDKYKCSKFEKYKCKNLSSLLSSMFFMIAAIKWKYIYLSISFITIVCLMVDRINLYIF